MTLLQILRLTLHLYGEEPDEAALAEYRERMVAAVNEAYDDICLRRLQPISEMAVTVSSTGRVSKNAFPTRMIEPLALRSPAGHDLFFVPDKDGLRIAGYVGPAQMEYSCLPVPLLYDPDVPVIDAHWHWCLADYACWRLMSTGSRERQARSETFLQNYLRALTHMLPRSRIRAGLTHKYT